MWFMLDPGDVLEHTSPHILSVQECPFYIHQKCDISCWSSQYIPANKTTTLDRPSANCGTIPIPYCCMQCSYTQPDSAYTEDASWLSLVPFWLVANYIIFRASHSFSSSSSSPFHNSKSWLQKYFNQARLKTNQADWQTLQTGRHPVRHSSNADTSQFTATLQL